MRLLVAAVFAASFASFAAAQDAAQDIDDAILARVAEIATMGYANPGAAVVTNVTRSRARNGMGYCGEVTVEGAGGVTTTFHVLLETAGGPSVLRLADFPETDQSPNAQTVRQMMMNFGCTG